MDVRILHLLEGARQARGVAIIIDVFRAFSLEAYLFSRGVEKIIPTADLDLAYRYKREDPTALLVGERGGAMCEGFDFGNSPAQIEHADLTGKTVIHTTSAGTQGLSAAVGDEGGFAPDLDSDESALRSLKRPSRRQALTPIG